MTETAFKPHPRFARFWIKLSPKAEQKGQSEHREDLLAGLRGRVIEVGAGNGLNFSHYPPEVTEVVAVEPEPTLRGAGEKAAADAPVPVKVVDGLADQLPANDGEFDAAVVSLVLCSVPEQATALTEIRRTIKPGGELRFYEHVQAESRAGAALLTLAERTVWPHLGGGCHPARHTEKAIEAAGFEITQCRRFGFAPGALAPKLPHILGRALRP